nr:hypothetical protein [Tanacetum cinerariifolium]
MESIFTTGSSTVTPIPSPKSTMTPSIMTTTTIASQPSIPPTPIPNIDLQNLLTFASVFRFEDRVKSLKVNFSEFMQTNQSTEAVFNIPGLAHQYIHQEMPEAVREAVQIQTDRLQDSLQRENDEFLRTIDDNMKKINKEQMEGYKSIQRSDEQRNLYKALVEAYDADKTILDTYGESAILKRRREEDDDQEGPSTGSDRGSKRRREGGEHASASTSSEPATGSAEDQPIVQTSQHPEWFSQPRRPPTLDRDWNKTLPAASGNAQSWISALAKQTDAHSLFNEILNTLIDFSNFIMNRLGIDTLTPELLAGPTYELIRGSCNFKRLRFQDIEDMLILLVQRKLSNPTVKERFAFNVSLRMFTRSIVIQRRVEDLQLGVESYQKRLNLAKPDTYRSDLKRREWYTAYSNPKGFIYQNRDKKNRLIRIDKLYKFSDGKLNDIRNALDDRLKGIKMQYLPTTIWRKGDKDRAATMIQAIDKMLKTRRIMRSLERFIGGRQYEGDFQML